MKKLALALCLLPMFSYAATTQDNQLVSTYQDLCAKEQDPVKRQNYCHLLAQPSQKEMIAEQFRQDIAIV